MISDPTILAYLDPEQRWCGLRGIGRVTAERRIDGEVSQETRSFLLSFPLVETFARAVRGHWGIEKSLHWVLDLAFREDESPVRVGHAPEHLAVLRHLSLNLLRRETTAHVGVHAYLLRVLDGIF